MARYITVRLTWEQAHAAWNACDLIADNYDADNNKREAGCYHRAGAAIERAIKESDETRPRR